MPLFFLSKDRAEKKKEVSQRRPDHLPTPDRLLDRLFTPTNFHRLGGS
jgi:hypothetical protein